MGIYSCVTLKDQTIAYIEIESGQHCHSLEGWLSYLPSCRNLEDYLSLDKTYNWVVQWMGDQAVHRPRDKGEWWQLLKALYRSCDYGQILWQRNKDQLAKALSLDHQAMKEQKLLENAMKSYQLGNYAEAIRDYRALVKINKCEAYMNNLALAYMGAGLYDTGIRQLQRALKEYESLELRMNLMRIYQRQEDIKRLEALLTETRKAYDHPLLFTFFGWILKSQGQHDGAINAYIRAYEGTQNPENLVYACQLMGSYGQIDQLQLILRTYPISSGWQDYLQAIYYQSMGDLKEYGHFLQQAVEGELQPLWCYELGTFLAREHRIIEALKMVQTMEAMGYDGVLYDMLQIEVAYQAGNHQNFSQRSDTLLKFWQNQIRRGTLGE